jgi:8-oxo-dGTP pyrophosphatase MutT (NUDIX family)
MERTVDAAGCVIFDEAGKVLLVHQTYGAMKWALPGGIVEKGEAVWETAVRECKEEIGIEVTDLILSGLFFIPPQCICLCVCGSCFYRYSCP